MTAQNKTEQKDLTLNQFVKQVGWSKRKFHRHREQIAERYKLDLELFKKDRGRKEEPVQDDDHYLFKREWNELAVALFKMYDQSPFKGKGKDIEKLSLEKLMHFQKYAVSIIAEMGEGHAAELLGHPAFHSAIIESYALQDVVGKYDMLMQAIESVSMETRSMFWVYFSKQLSEMLIMLYRIDLYGKKQTEKEMVGFEAFTFSDYKHKSLDFLIAAYLKKFLQEETPMERECFEKTYNEAVVHLDNHISDEEKAWIDKLWKDDHEKIYRQFAQQSAHEQIREAIEKQLNQLKATSEYIQEALATTPNLHRQLELEQVDLDKLLDAILQLESGPKKSSYSLQFQKLFSQLIGSVMERE